MSANSKRNPGTSTASIIYPQRFHNNRRESISSTNFDINEYEIHSIKQYIEDAIHSALSDIRLKNIHITDDPFDAIYLSQLQPDAVNHNDINTLEKYRGIKDLSSEIFFDDGWDD